MTNPTPPIHQTSPRKLHKPFNPDEWHLMIDIETLGVQEMGAPIVSIAAVPFQLAMANPIAAEKQWVWYVDPHPEAQIQYDTVRWWLQQPPAAREAAFNLCNMKPVLELEVVIDALFSLYATLHCQAIWCKSITFDIQNIEFYAKLLDIEIPWGFRERMDVRPFAKLVGTETTEEIYSRYTAHSPVDDCRSQIDVVRHAYAMACGATPEVA